MVITKEQRKRMLEIAKPELIGLQADPFLKDTANLLLKRIEKKKSGVGSIILELMWIARSSHKN